VKKQHPFPTPLPVFTLFVSPWSNHILTLWFTHSLLISFLSHQSMSLSSKICIKLVQFVYIFKYSLPVCEASMQSFIYVQSLFWYYCQLVSIPTAWLAMGWMDCGSNSGVGKIVPNSPDWNPSPTQPPVQWVPQVSFPGVKWLGHGVN
jgi:hypothetical protein